MTADPRAALSTLMSAFERHLEAAASRRGDNDPVVVAAYQEVADAFDAYDDALLDAYGEVTPLEIYTGDDDYEDDEDEDDEDEDEDADGVGEDDDTDDEFDNDEEDDDAYVGMGDDDDVEFEDHRS